MFKVKKKTNGRMFSKGITFEFDKEVVVSKEIYDYLKKTFPDEFEFIAEKEKVVEQKVETSKRPTRRKTTTKDK